jgi:UDP-N-acetylmuramate: L-alanyl-gamma-D-glutamyl-meso-diaminopimelate ligase
VFEHELVRALGHADQIVMAAIFKPEAVPLHERLDAVNVIKGLQAHNKPARLLATADEIVENIAPELKPGDVVGILSNGGFGGIYEKLPARIRSLNEVNASAR